MEFAVFETKTYNELSLTVSYPILSISVSASVRPQCIAVSKPNWLRVCVSASVRPRPTREVKPSGSAKAERD